MPQTPTMPAVLTVAEVAELLRCEPSTVYRWCREGTVESVRVAGIVRVPARALEALMDNRTGGATP
jgi:excisionase family DNA binding protein